MRKFLLFIAAMMVAMTASAAYYLRGDLAGASWNAGVELVGGSITFDAVEGVNYEFKITESATAWEPQYGFSALTSVPEGVKETGAYGGNIGFTVPAACQVTITVVDGAITLTSTGGFGEIVVPEWDGTYYIAGTGDATTGFCCGEAWNPSACPLKDGTVSYTLPAGEYKFKITDGTWNSSWGFSDLADQTGLTGDADNNVVITLTEESNVTISYNGTQLSVSISAQGGSEGGEGEGGEEGGDDPIVTPTGTTYYLIGYINGADYGCEADYENMGDYKFVDGTLTATFEANSYVFVKTEGNGAWFMSEGFAAESPATLINTNEGLTEPDKLMVPGGVEVTFTLVENADGTLTLSYTTGTTTDLEDVDAEDAVVAAYDLIGRPVAADAKGLVILQYASGKAVKVYNN